MKWGGSRFVALLVLTSAIALPALEQRARSHRSKTIEPGWRFLIVTDPKDASQIVLCQASNLN
jgi:hypothetical protein